ncbi:MAG: flagellar biosynthetic protein FliQ [Gammaproteobacteria bacterium]|nr:flagellar biosynthetic protein FliQ [Gammaproteobacteria bacterium]
MEPTQAIGIGREAIWTVIYVAGPILITALALGLLIGVLQAATSIQEMTLSFIPKLIAVVAILMLFGDWQLLILTEFFLMIFERIPELFSQ